MNLVRTSVAVALASGVAVASLALPGAATASTVKTSSRAGAAAGYLARQLQGKHHDHYVDVFGKSSFPDDGETADAVLSMDAAGFSATAAARATKWLEQDATNYLTGSGFTPTGTYPGAAAKLLLVDEAQHVSPTKFGSVDLIGDLVSDEGAGVGAAPGQFQNAGDPGSDSSSVLIQSLAVLALADAPTTTEPDSAATSYLNQQACANGGFQLAVRSSGDCTTEDVDVTSYAIQALMASGQKTDVAKAIRWLLSKRNPDGGWGEQPGNSSDANSTALAVEALVATHRSVTTGVLWLENHQQACKSKVSTRGAVRFKGGKYVAAEDLRATSQAGVALAYKSLSSVDTDGSRRPAPYLKC